MQRKLLNQFISRDLFLIASWLLLALIYLAWPARSPQFTMAGFYLSGAYCLLMLLSEKMFSLFFGCERKSISRLEIPQKLLYGFAVLAALGLVLHLYDKMFLRGYDYFSCKDIREIWLDDGRLRNGQISSWQSAAGHLLVYFCFLPVAFLRIQNKLSALVFYFGLACFVVYAWTIGSRSSMLLFSTLVFVVLIDLKQKKLLFPRELAIKAISVATVLMFFIAGTFLKKFVCYPEPRQRVYMDSALIEHHMGFKGAISPDAAIYHFQSELRAMEKTFQWLRRTTELPTGLFVQTGTASYLVNITSLYATIGINNFSQALQSEFLPDHKFIFSGVIRPLQRVGLFTDFKVSELRSVFGRGYINFPGTMALTFGRFGFYTSAVVLGFLLFLTKLLDVGRYSTYFIPLRALVFSVFVLAPLINVLSLMSAPFLFLVICIFLLSPLFLKSCRSKID